MFEEPHRLEHPYRCALNGCSATHPRSRFDAIRAGELGWFFQRDGRSWCPEHNPPWVKEWRARRVEAEEG